MSYLKEKSPKKRKHGEGSSRTPAKKSKRESAAESKDKETDFQVVRSSLVVSIPPIFASSPRAGVMEMLDSMVMRYIPTLQGVVLSHSNLRFTENTGLVQADCPFLICNVIFDAMVWSPRVGMTLAGKINLCSPDHISLLLHRTFNISIPRHHIPEDRWEFIYGPAENDPEFGPDAQEVNKLHGDGGSLEFTVIGLTVANEMLSLLGSIQTDPFSPDHVPRAGPLNDTSGGTGSDSEGSGEPDEGMYNEDALEIASDDEEDTFVKLGLEADKAASREAKRKAEVAAQVAKEEVGPKRKKRKDRQQAGR
ncbi:hypothetical protein BD779DRAFT_1505440 [Infundibulicybe gibba]|nr:hypothetical protein BD779DRAFT_1505440 [Infundibulicybe gibba]